MTPTQDLLKLPLPKWMSSHPIFKEVKQINKVFPGIGLPNSEEEGGVDGNDTATKSAKVLLKDIAYSLEYGISDIKFLEKNPKFKNKSSIPELIDILSQIKREINKSKSAFITTNNGRITLNIPKDITPKGSDKPFIRKGEGLFRVYNKLNERIRNELKVPTIKQSSLNKLEDIETFKQFSSDNLPSNKFKVVFSSDGVDGLWDIATMSERGVSSCQSWQGDYKHCLIGSVIDPFVGIIYLTSGAKFNDRGSKMIKRCLVRFIISEKDRKPYLLIDNMYPSQDKKIIEMFKDFLKKKTDNKFEVHYAGSVSEKLINNSYIPLTEIRKKLENSNASGKDTPYDHLDSIASYQDYPVKSMASLKKDKQAVLFDKNSKKKAKKFVKSFSTAFVDSIKDTEVKQFPEQIKPIIKKLRGEEWNYSNLVANISKSIANDILATVDKSNFTNSDTYTRRVYYSYFLNKKKILNAAKTKLTKEINGGLKLKNKLKSAQLLSMMNLLLPKIDHSLKEQLNELVEKRKEKFSGALPLP